MTYLFRGDCSYRRAARARVIHFRMYEEAPGFRTENTEEEEEIQSRWSACQ
jgi:hypothetical protein